MTPQSEIRSLPPAVLNDPVALKAVSEAIELRHRFETRYAAFIKRFGREPRLPASYFEDRAAVLAALAVATR